MWRFGSWWTGDGGGGAGYEQRMKQNSAVVGLLAWVVVACVPEPTVTPRRADAGIPGSFCTEVCQTTADCLTGFNCESARCVRPDNTPRCLDTEDCQARAAGWSQGCMDDNGCATVNTVCVVGSPGYCARVPTAVTPCSQTALEEMTINRANGMGQVTVCGVPRARCNRTTGACFTGCRTNGDCGGELPVCNTGSGLCECSATSCRTNASVCVAGRCECAQDNDCTINADTCYSGACGCSTAMACDEARAHPGTAWSCR
jgi:hypothetical protein